MDTSSLSRDELIKSLRTFKDENKEFKAENKELKAENKELKKDSITDDLTGLFSMKYAEKEIQRSLQLLPPVSDADRRGKNRLKCVTVVFCDIDNLKVANDTVSHDFGDELIKNVAFVLSHNVREIEIVARRSGDEMLIVLPDMTEDEAVKKIGFLQKKISEISFQNNPEFEVSVSMGSSTAYTNDGSRLLVGAAETAMYVEKRTRGKGRGR